MIVSKINESFIKIECGSTDRSNFEKLRRRFSFVSKSAKFDPSYRMGYWDGRTYIIDSSGIVGSGIYTTLKDYCDMNNILLTGYNPILELKQPSESTIQKLWEIVSNCGFDLRDYQIQGIINALGYRKNILEIATGGGKSAIIYMLIMYMRYSKKVNKILLIVPNILLTNQMYTDFKNYGWDSIDQHLIKLNGTVHKDIKSEVTNKIEKDVLLTTWQSVCKRESKFFTQFEAVIVDECHLAASKNITMINQKTNKAIYKIGTTGTMSEQGEPEIYWPIISNIGPISYVVKAQELINNGTLATLTIQPVFVSYPYKFIQTNNGRPYLEETTAIEEYANRNTIFSNIVTDINGNSIILVKKIKHLDRIVDYLKNTLDEKYSIYAIHGQIKADVREKIRVDVNLGKYSVIVGTYATVSTGLNIPNINSIIFGITAKSKYKVLQAIGRGLRKTEIKTDVIVYDIVDDLRIYKKGQPTKNNYSYRHYLERKRYYNEQNFDILADKKITI